MASNLINCKVKKIHMGAESGVTRIPEPIQCIGPRTDYPNSDSRVEQLYKAIFRDNMEMPNGKTIYDQL